MSDSGKNALLVDVSNFNAVFKTNGKITLGLNYSECPEKLIEDAKSLGRSYDVYLNMLPRMDGEGDVLVDELSIISVPFIASSKELSALNEFWEKAEGVDNVYLCNFLYNFVISAKMDTFEAGMNYGNRFAYLKVKGKIVNELAVYNSLEDLYSSSEPSSIKNWYGEPDITDVNGIKSKYPELSHMERMDLYFLAPIMASYLSGQYVLLSQLLSKSASCENDADNTACADSSEKVDKITEIPTDIAAVVPEIPSNQLDTDTCAKEITVQAKEPKIVDNLILLRCFLTVVILICAAIHGVGRAQKSQQEILTGNANTVQEYAMKMESYRVMEGIFETGLSSVKDTNEILEYCNSYGNSVEVSSLEMYQDRYVLNCKYPNEEVRKSFVDFLKNQYEVIVDTPISDGASGLESSITIVS